MAKTTSKKIASVYDEKWTANATFRERPAVLDTLVKFDSYIQFGIDFRKTIHFISDHGIGKTSRTIEALEARGLQVCYINLANITPDDKLVVAPVRGKDGQLALRQLVMEDLVPGVPYAIVLDDPRQASQQVLNQFMQLTNNWTIGQQQLPDLKAVVMLDNEGAAEGIRVSEDLAIADRKVTVCLTANDTGWRYALAAKYNRADLAGVFDTWDSLNAEIKHVLSPRCLDHVLFCALNGLPPIFGLPIVGDQRRRLTTTGADGTRVVDRTKEILEKVSTSLGLAYIESTPDYVAKSIKLAMEHRLAIMIQGGPGIGKTEVTKALIAEAGLAENYYSMPFCDPESLMAPLPSDGKLTALLSEELRSTEPYAIIWDEYNRPSSQAAFAKLMEITQQWMLGGIALEGCRAQIALCNPSEWLGRKMQVSKGNIAQADRFTISIQITADDIAANEWLLTQWPDKVSNGDPDRRERARSVIETVIEWYKNDIGDEHRQWITKRTLERLAMLHMAGLPLEFGKMYVGDGEYAPVNLLDLEARLANRPMARLKEIAANLPMWEARLAAAKETSDVGTNDVDQVHQALTLAETSQLWDNFEAVVALTRLLPPKMKITFFVGADAPTMALWIKVYAVIGGETTLESVVRPS